MSAITGVKRRHGRRKRALAAALVAIVLAVPGCGLSPGQREAVRRFGDDAAALGTIAGEEFAAWRGEVVRLNTRRLTLGDAGVDPERLDGPLTLEAVAVRVSAAEAMRDYGVLLSRLAAGEDGARVVEALSRLTGSLRRLRDAGRMEVSDERLGAIGRAVADVAGLAVEGRRAAAVREVMSAASPAVRRLAELIRQDFDPDGERWAVGVEAAALRLGEQVARVRDELGRRPRGAGLTDRLAAEAMLAEADALRAESLERVRVMGERIAAAAGALLLAEQDVRGTLATDAYGLDDAEAFADRVAELVTAARLLAQ